MKYSIAIAGFVLSFMMAAFSVGVIGWVVSIFVAIHRKKTDDFGLVPDDYWPIIWTVAGVVAIAAGVHSFRATLKRCQKHKS